MERGKRAFGIVLICVSLLALFSWEKFGRAQFIDEEILVLRGDVQRGTVVTEKMMKTVRTDRVLKGMMKPGDQRKILGKAALHDIPDGAPLYGSYFRDAGLMTGREYGRYRLSIPERWILSCPEDLRPGDRIHVLCSGKEIAEARVLSWSAENRSLCAAVTASQAEAVSEQAAENGGVVICAD